MNGVEASNSPISSTYLPFDAGELRIGSGYGGTFSGILDEVRIYNRALGEDEVRQVYSGLVSAGQIATVKFITSMDAGTHIVRLCTPSACQTGYLTII